MKTEAPDPLLLSEAICRQLGIIHYHSNIKPLDGNGETEAAKQSIKTCSKQVLKSKVKMIQTVRLPAQHTAVMPVKIDGNEGTLLLEPNPTLVDMLGIEDSLLEADQGGTAMVVVSNKGRISHLLKQGEEIGTVRKVSVTKFPDKNADPHLQTVSFAEIECADEDSPDAVLADTVPAGKIGSLDVVAADENADEIFDAVELVTVEQFSQEKQQWRKQQLKSLYHIKLRPTLLTEDKEQLIKVLAEHHSIFSLEEGERGETSLAEFAINTGDSAPKKQAARRIPYAARQEITSQLKRMQPEGVIESSESPWASPVVLVRKRDGSLHFCVDYRGLNAVTKADVYPLPRIDDLLDKLGKAKCFSTLDLTAGYWQIRVQPDSQEKTAFITHQGLYEFKVMPFGVMNAPAVFQKLMQKVLARLMTGPEDFVAVYLDDVIVFSQSLQAHLEHLTKVFACLREANLKLNPKKCEFMSEEVGYLGHIVTPQGLKPNQRNLDAVKEFPIPTNLKKLRQFLDLTSHSRRFILCYAKIAQPLYDLTRQGTPFNWTASCE